MKTALFRVDASPEIGGGHLFRCAALAKTLARNEWHCRFAVSRQTLNMIPASLTQKFAFDILDEPAAESSTVAEPSVDVVIIDHYGIENAEELALARSAKQVLVIDDLPGRRHSCDWFVNSMPGAQADDFRDQVPEGCIILPGGAYALLQPIFWRNRLRAFDVRQGKSNVRRILVNFGAVDTHGMTARVLAGLRDSERELTVDIMLGLDGHLKPELTALAQGSNLTLCFHDWVDDPSPLMVEADLAIGAAGISALERCSLGLPSLLVVTAENQRQNAERLGTLGAAMVLGAFSSVNAEQIISSVNAAEAILGDMSTAAANVCDGLGAARVAVELERPEARDGRPIRICPMLEEHVDQLYQWQQAPDVRQYFRNSSMPGYHEHVAWFIQKLNDPKSQLYLVLCGGVPAGVLRFDYVAGSDSFEVSIIVAPDFQGSGIGTIVLKMARALLPDFRLSAEIDPDNLPSVAAFLAAGFSRTGYRTYLRQACEPTGTTLVN